MGALAHLHRQGKALYIGISSYSPELTRKAAALLREERVPLFIHQPNYSMFNRWIEKRLTQACHKAGMGIIAFCPLYQGLLTNKYLDQVPQDSRANYASQFLRPDDMSQATLNVVRDLAAIAADRSQTLAQMAIAWILRLDGMTSVLCGASRPEQIIENCKALENTSFSESEILKIDGLLNQAELPTSLWAREID